jgi:hypothetical protein
MGKRTKDDGVNGTGAAPAVLGGALDGPAGDDLPTLSAEELEGLLLAPGVTATEEALTAEEGKETGREQLRRETLSTGAKLLIVGDLAKGMTVPQVAKKHGLNKAAVIRVASDPELYGVTDKSAVKITKSLLASRFYQLADLALSHIDAEKLKRMDPYRLAFMSAVALDKARLLEGESTENLSFKGLALNIHATLENLKERKRAILDKVSEMRLGAVVQETETE